MLSELARMSSKRKRGLTLAGAVHPAARCHVIWVGLAFLIAACAPAAPSPTTPPAKPAATQAAPAAKAGGDFQVDVAAAKAEGKVVGYGVLIDSQWKALNDIFQPKIGIPVENWRGPSARVVSRVETEKSAGQHLFDFVGVDTGILNSFAKQGYIEKLPPALLSRVDQKYRDPNGFWVQWVDFPVTVIYNTQLVPAAEAPKTLEDVLNPKWRGKIAMTDPTLNDTFTAWFFAIRKQLGEDRAKQFFTDLAAQNPTMFESGLTVSQNVNQGQFALGFGFLTHVLSVGGKDGHMAYMPLNPMLANNSGFALASNPPHPKAALAVGDVFLSREFLQASGDLGYPVHFPGVKSAIPGVDELTIEPLPELSSQQIEEMMTYLKGFFRK
jgi:iron(III) transport system substrate-binding protein